MKKIPKEIIWLLLYFVLCFGIDYFIYLFSDFFTIFANYFQLFPKIRAFFFLFLIQEAVLLLFVYISFQISFDKGTSIISYFKARFKWLWWKKLFGYAFASFFVYLFIVSSLYSILNTLNIKLPWFFGEQSVSTLLEKLNQPWIVASFVILFTVVILWPIVEEIIYRWYVADVLIKKIGKVRWILISAFMFAFVHMEFSVLWNLFILALILSYIYYKTESLRYSLAFHMLINWMWVLVLFLS